MSQTLKKLLLTFGLATLVATPAVQAQKPNPQLFQSDRFQEIFEASYLSNVASEPRLSPPQRDDLNRAVEELAKDRAAGIRFLEQRASDTNNPNAAIHFMLGNLRFENGNFRAARSSYEAAIAAFPNYLRAHQNLGFLLFQAGDFAGARASLAKSIQLGSEEDIVYGLLGYCFYTQEKYLASESSYRQAIVFNPNYIDWVYGLASSLLKQGKYAESLFIFDDLIEENPGRAEYWSLQAQAFLGLDRPMSAASNLEMIYRMGTIDVEDLIVLGDIYVARSLYSKALEVYLRAVQGGGAVPASLALGAASRLLGPDSVEEASQLVVNVAETYGDQLDPRDRYMLAKLRAQIAVYRNEADDKVAALLEEVVAQNPLDGEVLVLLAGYYADEGDIEKASLLFDRAAKVDSFEAEALFQWAKMLVDNNRYDRAIRLLRRSLDLRSSDHVDMYLGQVENIQRATR